jgi:glycosyltransferase involved in cell wall biosynthesis
MINVLMLAYNSEKTIDDAIMSVLIQHVDLKLIVVDDGSTDATPDLVLAHRHADERIVLIRHGENEGVTTRLSTALNYIPEGLICRMDSDDIFLPGALAALKSRYQPKTIVYGPFIERSVEGVEKTVYPQNIWECMAGGTLMNIDDIQACGGYIAPDVGVLIEYDLYARLITQGGLTTISTDKPLLVYQRRRGSITMNQKRMAESMELLKAKWGNNIASKIRSY